MKYDWILFDADETLFHFDAFKGLQLMFSRKGVDFTEQDYKHYQSVNKPLWVDYQDGRISAEELKHTRFIEWASKLKITTNELNSAFLIAMADICTLLPGAKTLIEALHGKSKLAIVTNGFTELQAIRLEKTGMTHYFDQVIISEQVGVAKPDVGIFDYTYEKIGRPCKSKILMVGDNPHSDIVGGINFGIDTCWLNTHSANAEGIKPSYQINTLGELQTILLS